MHKLLKLIKIVLTRLLNRKVAATLLSVALTDTEKSQLKAFLLELKTCTQDPYELLDELPDNIRSIASKLLNTIISKLPESVSERKQYIDNTITQLLSLL